MKNILCFIYLLSLLCSCATIVRSEKQTTAVGVVLDLKVKAYFEKCDILDNYNIYLDYGKYLGTVECVKENSMEKK